MAAQILFISETKLKAYTTLNQNIDMALLTSCIFIAQEIHLQVIIGTKGYDYYQTLIQANQLSGATISTADRIMLDEYIAPYLVHAAAYEAMPEIFARKMNKAITVGNTEQGTSIDIKGMSYLRDIEQSRYNFYAQRMMDRLLNFPNDYPWYYSYSSKDGMPTQKTQYFGGMWFTPGLRYPPRHNQVPGNMPAYWGPEYSRCTDCG